MASYRIEFGRQHGARHAAIVGAIANDAGIPGKRIGRIQLFDDHSIVDLPERMPRSVFMALKSLRIRQRPLRIRRLQGAPRR
jgi:ATP-dependent RNA helicase DeaD